MDIKRINPNYLADTTQGLQVNRGEDSNANKSKNENLTPSATDFGIDSAESDAFAALKNKVAIAKEASRAEYIERLKQSITSGQYNPNSTEIADSVLKDGFAEFLFS